MKPQKGLSYFQIILIALLTEMTLIIIQFVYMNVFVGTEPGSELAFTTEYMKTTGFFIFQIIGFILYTLVVYLLSIRLQEKILNKILVLVITGGIVELSFYLIIQAEYEGAFLYSILDKFMGAISGIILFVSTNNNPKKPGAYLK